MLYFKKKFQHSHNLIKKLKASVKQVRNKAGSCGEGGVFYWAKDEKKIVTIYCIDAINGCVQSLMNLYLEERPFIYNY